jgi:tetratricopeptide (TPR) repeat protein
MCLALSGRAEEAIAELQAAMAAEPEMTESRALVAWAQALAGHRDDARRTLRAAEAMPRGANDIGIAFAIGRAFVALGERDSAFTWFDRTQWKWPHLNSLYDPSLDPIRSDPRFALLAARVARELNLD